VIAPPAMPLQNRVTPEGDIIAVAARGTLMGNRGGAFHRDDRTLGVRRCASRHWICCLLAFKGRRRVVMSPGLYTELFFLDEATALAAGHRPCFECRRADAERFAMLWNVTEGRAGRARADEMDRVLHRERRASAPGRARAVAATGELPDGVMVWRDGAAALLAVGAIRRWSPAGYGPAVRVAPADRLEVLTPPSIVRIVAAGYVPSCHPSATAEPWS
jgi:hypothetical protein